MSLWDFMAEPKSKILLVDDEPDVLETTKWAFEAVGYEVSTARSGEDAIKRMAESKPDLLLVDYKLPQMSGLDFIRLARALDPSVSAIIITGLTHQTESVEKACEELGTYAFLHKPLRMEEVLQIVKNALQSKTAA
jgi:DNA-binding response OmpR family regulator